MGKSAPFRLSLLGGFGLRRPDGAPLILPTLKIRLLLSYLATSPSQTHARPKLATMFWGSTSEDQARGSLRNALSAIRNTLQDEIIQTTHVSVSLAAGCVTTDVEALEKAAAETTDLGPAITDLYPGEFLEGCSFSSEEFDPWLNLCRTRCRELAQTAFEHAIDRLAGAGRLAEACTVAQRLVSLDPLREQSHQLLMTVYMRSGERSKSLEQYSVLERSLARELNVAPSVASKELARRIADDDAIAGPEAKGQGDKSIRVRAESAGLSSIDWTAHASQTAASQLPVPDRPSIAVLPFTNISSDPDQEYFADGLVEEIITGLSRVRSFFVIARNSTFTYKGRAVDVRQVSQELGVRYVLEGSIRKSGNRVRIVGQLIDAATGHHIWADRFEGDLGDIFELQDRVTESVVGAVEPSIRLQEIRQARTRPTSSITAYDLYLRALPRFYSMTREGFADVRRLTNEALTIDPGFTLAKALGAYIRSISVSQVWHEPDDRHVAIRMASEVLAEARDDPTSLRFAAQVLAYSARDYDQALAAIARSLHLNPSSAQGYTGGGWVNAHASRPLIAIEHFHKALRLSPLDPEKGIALSGIGMSYLMLQDYSEALQWGQQALTEMPNYGSSHRVVVVALVELQRMADARNAAERMMATFPTYSLALQREINPWRDQAFGERYIEAMRLAGVPE